MRVRTERHTGVPAKPHSCVREHGRVCRLLTAAVLALHDHREKSYGARIIFAKLLVQITMEKVPREQLSALREAPASEDSAASPAVCAGATRNGE